MMAKDFYFVKIKATKKWPLHKILKNFTSGMFPEIECHFQSEWVLPWNQLFPG
jgi:hypothetical protein